MVQGPLLLLLGRAWVGTQFVDFVFTNRTPTKRAGTSLVTAGHTGMSRWVRTPH